LKQNVDKRYIFLTTKKDNNGVIISIKDNGGGIGEEIKEHIFEPYFTTKHKSQGTGLGLHMTYNMITVELQGVIVVKNRTFEFEKRYLQWSGVYYKIAFRGCC
jgi:two-component system, NarL family, sensor histidine kinase EvgS